mmetsp:Transcript_53451/g.60664  ORF Transcript_53451/g.60664 Transcript_53451/m.60664 type:complete len:96 (-) Transcript_53451:349-636(-)
MKRKNRKREKTKKAKWCVVYWPENQSTQKNKSLSLHGDGVYGILHRISISLFFHPRRDITPPNYTTSSQQCMQYQNYILVRKVESNNYDVSRLQV